MKRIIRVFPRRTSATPDDWLVRVNVSPTAEDEADEIHISVAFTWDIPVAEKLELTWRCVAPVKIGGPAYNDPGGIFTPGMYVKNGFVITSRGCPNSCWFCSVPKREGQIRELPITGGWDVLDSNLLACSEEHQERVFDMLARQPEKARFTGGLEPALITPKIAAQLRALKPKSLFVAYDTPSDLRHIQNAGRLLLDAGFTRKSHMIQCYVLCGFQGDTFDKAVQRFKEAWRAGFLPFAMLYRDQKGEVNKEWRKFQRLWARPILTVNLLEEKHD